MHAPSMTSPPHSTERLSDNRTMSDQFPVEMIPRLRISHWGMTQWSPSFHCSWTLPKLAESLSSLPADVTRAPLWDQISCLYPLFEGVNLWISLFFEEWYTVLLLDRYIWIKDCMKLDVVRETRLDSLDLEFSCQPDPDWRSVWTSRDLVSFSRTFRLQGHIGF